MSAPPREILQRLQNALLTTPPAGFTGSDIRGFFRRYGPTLEAQLSVLLGEDEDLHGRARTDANLAAIRLLAELRGRRASPAQRAILSRYSGWGGLSIRKVASQIPREWLPDKQGLIHEYYTPTRVWRAVAELLRPERDRLVAETGRQRLTALEPSAGIGRALRAFRVEDGWDLDWTAVEVSETSAALLRALFPALTLHVGPFEGWRGGPFDLVISNPPYGPRPYLELDPDFASKRAYLYFVERCLSLLVRGGLAAFIVPTGLLTGKAREMVRARERVLSLGHLLGAWRLPSESPRGNPADVPYDSFVVDLLVFAGRGGRAAVLPKADTPILEGQYYQDYPTHILGEEIAGDDWEPGKPKPRRGYQVRGIFAGFGAWEPRPMEQAPVRTGRKASALRGGIARALHAAPANLPLHLDQAVRLGLRADAWLAALARQERAAVDGWAELVRDLASWREANGQPHKDHELRLLASEGVTGAQRFLALWQAGDLLPGLKQQPLVEARYQGEWTLAGVADWLWRQQGGHLTMDELAEWWATSTGRPRPSEHELRAGLDGWCLDGTTFAALVPEARYYEGFLWHKHDEAQRRADSDLWAARQWKRLKELIGWRSGPELLETTLPVDSWLPIDLVSAWAAAATGTSRHLVREDALLQPEGIWYASLNNTEKNRTPGFSRDYLSFIGWANIDRGLWNPEREEQHDPETGKKTRQPVEEARAAQREAWTAHFHAWVQAEPSRLEALEEAYNRRIRGWAPIDWPTEPIPLARWSPQVVLRPHQNRGVHLVRAARTGLLAFDVGLGKTYTGLAILACGRQEGWARRPVVLVPNSLVWKWYRDFERCLPDYRVAVIGSDRRVLTRGPRRGRLVAEPDTPEDRARKWTAFAAGEYDAVILAYSALGRTQIDAGFVEDYVSNTTALKRAIALSLSAAGDEDQARAQRSATERQEAVEQARVRAWVGDILSPPKNWVYDPGVDWHALGVDMLLVDEAQNFKNLFSSAQVGAKNDRDETGRAWALELRCASVRAHSGGGGVVLLSATPAKNAPEEFYTMYHFLRPSIWAEVGIDNHEAFVSRFGQISERLVPDAGGQRLVKRNAFTGWRNLEELRGVVYRWGDYRTAEQVGISLPEAVRRNHQVAPSSAQLVELQALYKELAEIEEKLDLFKRMSGKQDMQAQIRVQLEKKRGVALKIYLTYLHPNLPGIGADRVAIAAANAGDGPKLVACAEEVLATARTTCSTASGSEDCCLDCGHIIFCDNVAVHYWMRELLVARGIPAKEIAILNAIEAGDIEYRQQVVEGFNGVGCPDDEVYTPPRFNVVIANAVAYEGMDLQRRTCAIHHLDVPWEPATLQQRNGRGVRQGNLFDEIVLHYYFVEGSNEIHRVDRIERKRGWMSALIEGAGRATNTTQEEDLDESGLEDLALAHAPADVRERIRRARAEQLAADREAKRAEGRRAANRALRQVAALWARQRREDDPERAAALAHQADQALRELGRFPGDLWDFDWHERTAAARETTLFVPDQGPPLLVGEWVALDEIWHEVSAVGVRQEKTRSGERLIPGVWLRPALQVAQTFIAESEDLTDRILLGSEAGSIPPDESGLEQRLANRLAPWSPYDWGLTGWPRLAPARQIAWWDALAPHLRDFAVPAELYPYDAATVQVPAEVGGRLELLGRGEDQSPRLPAGGEVLAPTPIGWARFLELARTATMKWTALDAAARWWWDRRMPRGRLQQQPERAVA